MVNAIAAFRTLAILYPQSGTKTDNSILTSVRLMFTILYSVGFPHQRVLSSVLHSLNQHKNAGNWTWKLANYTFFKSLCRHLLISCMLPLNTNANISMFECGFLEVWLVIHEENDRSFQINRLYYFFAIPHSFFFFKCLLIFLPMTITLKCCFPSFISHSWHFKKLESGRPK